MGNNNFVIVGLGGSGSMFLAERMSQTARHEVTHEGLHRRLGFAPDYAADRDWRQTAEAVNQYLRGVNEYGDVNTYARFYFEYLDAQVKRAIIVRNPFDLAASWYSACDGRVPDYFWLESYDSMCIFRRALGRIPGLKLIDFEKMTTDQDYLASVIGFFCGTCDRSRLTLNKVNIHRKRPINFEQLPEIYRSFWTTIVGDTYRTLQQSMDQSDYAIAFNP